jgi:hypothetical protein
MVVMHQVCFSKTISYNDSLAPSFRNSMSRKFVVLPVPPLKQPILQY